jgi:hypothetical protein
MRMHFLRLNIGDIDVDAVTLQSLTPNVLVGNVSTSRKIPDCCFVLVRDS